MVERNTRAYINMIKKNPVDIVSHLNYVCPADAAEVARCAADYGTYIELNSKKAHLTDEELFAVCETGVRFVVDSDAHSVDRVGDTKLVEEQLARVCLPPERIDNIDGRASEIPFCGIQKAQIKADHEFYFGCQKGDHIARHFGRGGEKGGSGPLSCVRAAF